MHDWFSAVRLWLTSGFRAAPGLACLAFAIRLAGAVGPPLQVYGLALIIDGAIDHQIDPLITGLGIIAATLTVTVIIQSFEYGVMQTMVDQVHTHLNHGLITTVAGIPGIEHHERPDIADRIELLRKDGLLLTFSFSSLVGVIAALANAAVVLGLLGVVHPALLVLPLLGALRVWASMISGRIQWSARETTAQSTRRADRLADLAADPSRGLEIRVFGLRTMLVRQVDGLLSGAETLLRRAGRAGAGYELAARVAFGAGYVAAIGFVAWQTTGGSASGGDLALIILLGARVEQTATAVAEATRNTGQTIRAFTRLAWVRRYAAVARPNGGLVTTPTRISGGISLRNVSFSYPGTGTPVLRELTLHLPAGATVALVGENGAGKTTLIKLLTKLYEPSEGVIMIDRTELAGLDPETWRSRTSAAFQDFARYELSAREAVGVGELSLLPDDRAIRAALDRAAAGGVVDELPRGLATQLGRRFTSGVDLSGGQWQRLALARAFLRPSPLLLILDEPTAALDPETEYALFGRYAAASAELAAATGGVTLLVSHRFSTVRMADLIVVLHEGRIVESGDHRQLLAAGGRYADLFRLQARAYGDGWGKGAPNLPDTRS
ncbi:ABC transporter ATP-binding protein [Microlunatus speluncae]|uniref:ABC transporter ATP-binding protein n=1 Tax=Microlunatus speluncae TaxID=2594267 RepID=UPI0012660B49|nr:ABC transporter ATP-binding protein [Microlunatus speluncae]